MEHPFPIRSTRHHRRHPWLAMALAWAAIILPLASCSVDVGVVAVEAEPTRGSPSVQNGSELDPATGEPVAPPSDEPSAPPSPPTEPAPTTPAVPAIAEPELFAEIPIEEQLDIDDNRPARDYDAFLAVALADIERWWGETYPAVYGDEFEPLAKGIFAGYPQRESEIPGCGEPRTRYADLVLFVAFYCELGDFMAFDDGDTPDSLLAPLAEQFGATVLGVVMAHEYGHAIQARIGALSEGLPTIHTEQQADCFAGAWVGQAYRGESPLLRLGDVDIRTALIAMLEVRDPVGTDQFVQGGHGSAFDRVGAFQEGFANGPSRCATLLAEPLPLMPNQFQTRADFLNEGNAPYDCDGVAECTPAPVFLADDLNEFWIDALGSGFVELTPAAVVEPEALECTDPIELNADVVLCNETDQVAYDEPDVVELYRDFGDFTLGYFYGVAWAERAQQVEASALTGEARALLSDCYTGAWVADITPDDSGETRRAVDTDGDGFKETGIRSSPGDLDEAIRMAILFGDAGANVDAVGSPFEKIESFRLGVLGGRPACQARFGA